MAEKLTKNYFEYDWSDHVEGGWTRNYFTGETRWNWDFKIQYREPDEKGVVIVDEVKVPQGKRGAGLGTWAWKLFERDMKKMGVKEIKLTAGYKNWAKEMNKLALDFWEKMGFTKRGYDEHEEWSGWELGPLKLPKMCKRLGGK